MKAFGFAIRRFRLFLKMGLQWPLFHLFLFFLNKKINFYNKSRLKMTCPSSIRLWDSNPWPLEHDQGQGFSTPQLTAIAACKTWKVCLNEPLEVSFAVLQFDQFCITATPALMAFTGVINARYMTGFEMNLEIGETWKYDLGI